MSLKFELQTISPMIIPEAVRAHEERTKALAASSAVEFESEYVTRELDYPALFDIALHTTAEVADKLEPELKMAFLAGAARVVEILIEIAEIQDMPPID